MGRLCVRTLVLDASHQRRKTRPIGSGVFDAQPVEGPGVAQQPRAPALYIREARFFGVGSALPSIELRLDWQRVDVAHQPSDELHLSAARLPFRDPAGFGNRIVGRRILPGGAMSLIGLIGKLAHGKAFLLSLSQGSFVGWLRWARVPGARGLLS